MSKMLREINIKEGREYANKNCDEGKKFLRRIKCRL